ncbi:unnamed protein product [Gulo gulo]|uniref:Uncharacterized protein n=1 Tax=Gulo gulo TaxID=48420 RepID=A0A9X9MBL2_GULGU|nr:unnamed protein product [Gulo gulo]
MERLPGGPWAGLADPGGPWAVAAGAAVPEAVGPPPWPGCCEAEEPGENGILAPLAGDRGERTVGRETGQWAQRVSRRLSPALGAPENVSGGHLLLEGDVRDLGTPGTELFTQDQVPLRCASVALPWAGIRNVPKSDSLLLLAKLYLIQWVFSLYSRFSKCNKL